MKLTELFYVLGREFAKGFSDELRSIEKPSEQPEAQPGKLVSAVFEEFHRHKCLLGEWRPDTQSRAVNAFSLFVEVVGDKPLTAITRLDGKSYLEALLKLPANKQKKRKYRDCSIDELLSLDIPESERWRKRTVNHTIKWVHGCFEWCKREGLIDSNPVAGLHVKETDTVPYRPFEKSRLVRLFSHPIYKDPACSTREWRTYKFWTPLLGLYTGARLGELCQLRVSDVKQSTDGIWYFSIQDEDADQTLKTTASIRKTPIGQQLIDLGFLDYCQWLKNSGETMLFPDLKRGQRGWQQYGSMRFAKMLEQQGIKERGITFHSFRKNAVDAVAANAPRDSLVSAVVGHAQMGMTFSRYFSEYPLSELKEVIDLIDYGIDLSHCKDGWKRYFDQ